MNEKTGNEVLDIPIELYAKTATYLGEISLEGSDLCKAYNRLNEVDHENLIFTVECLSQLITHLEYMLERHQTIEEDK